MRQGQLKSHLEEQQGDAEFGQEFHLVRGTDQAESVGAHQDAGHKETHQRRGRQTVRQRHDGDRHADKQRQVDQQLCFGHGSSSVSRVWR